MCLGQVSDLAFVPQASSNWQNNQSETTVRCIYLQARRHVATSNIITSIQQKKRLLFDETVFLELSADLMDLASVQAHQSGKLLVFDSLHKNGNIKDWKVEVTVVNKKSNQGIYPPSPLLLGISLTKQLCLQGNERKKSPWRNSFAYCFSLLMTSMTTMQRGSQNARQTLQTNWSSTC